MDTAEYNERAQPIRRAVNSLHEVNERTDLNSLLVDYVPRSGFEFVNGYFERLQMCWNTLVGDVEELMDTYDSSTGEFDPEPAAPPASYPHALRDMLVRMRLVVKQVGWMDTGLPRENIIEPQLGYALRYLVSHLQQGQGCAHGLVGIFEVDKQS
jgi:hypothetical protein